MLSILSARRYLPSIVFLLSGFNLFAQDFEIIKIQSAYYPPQSIGESTIEGEIGFFESGIQFAVPQTFKKLKKTIFIHKLGYGNLIVNTEANLPLGKVNSEQYYHSIIYNLGLVQTLDTNWRLVVNLIPTLASDFRHNLSGDDFLFQANALAINTKGKKLTYGFGLAYTTRFGRHLVLPMGLLKYKAKRFQLDAILPNKLDVMYVSASDIFSCGLTVGLNGGVFNTSSEVQTVNNVIDEVGYSRLTVGPAVAFKIKKVINIYLQGGVALLRRMEFIDINDEIIDRTPKAGPFFGLGLSYAPKPKDPKVGLNN